MEWRTRVTELLGCKYPILQGAFAGQGKWEFAAAVANTGAHGTITASVSRTPDQLREDIRKCREATRGSSGSFGVNFTFPSLPNIEEMVQVCLEERVTVETAAYRPDSLAPRIKKAGVKWIHKTARVKDALWGQSLGADAVIVVGLEGVGFKNPEQLPTFINLTWGLRQFKVPFIAAGGIGDARGFLGALAMGADGIMMGTAFLATKESPLDDGVKARIVEMTPDDPELNYRVLTRADPKEYAEATKLRSQYPLYKWLRMLERVNLRDPDWRKAAEDAPPPQPGIQAPPRRVGSLASGVVDRVPTVKEFIDSIIREAEEILDSRQFLKTR